MTATPTIAVVIRSHTDSEEVLDLVAALRTQTIAPHEIVVIDSGSAEAIVQRLRECSPPLRLMIIPADAYQSARTLNQAIETTDSELIAVISQDALPTDDCYLEHLAAAFTDPRIAGAYGRQIPHERSRRDPLIEKDLLKTYPPESRTQHAPDCWFVNTCAMVRRDLWQRHRFEERAVISEDHEWAKWAQREGHLIRYSADAVVRHSHCVESAAQLWRRHHQEGRGLGAIHGRGANPLRSLFECLRAIASDASWLLRRGRPLWLPVSVWRRMIKHTALLMGRRHARREIAT